MKQFTIKANIPGYYLVEDPKCPSYWKGSGCYDIDVPCTCEIEANIWAEDEDRAIDMLIDHDFERDKNNPYVFIVDGEPEILSIESKEADEDEEEIEVEYIKLYD